MCSGSEAGSYVWRIDFVYHSTLGLRVIQKEKEYREGGGVDVVPGGLGLAPGDGRNARRHPCLDRPVRLPEGRPFVTTNPHRACSTASYRDYSNPPKCGACVLIGRIGCRWGVRRAIRVQRFCVWFGVLWCGVSTILWGFRVSTIS